jgi:glycosyltransferase involved in cell wall biosynthesis
MKVAVYAICKNEEKFVDRWVASMAESDVIYVADTGSTDATVERLRSLGVTVHTISLSEWRFDVARNISLSYVPSDVDVCVCTDLDEVLDPGWRAKVEAAFKDPEVTRLKYWYTWNFLPDGTPGTQFWYDKIHRRHGYRWVHPVHEVLKLYGQDEKFTFDGSIHLKHYPDQTKSRGSYLPLLELSVVEDPNDDRNMHYLGREYTFYGEWKKAIETLQRHLALPTARWNTERASSMRLLGKSYTALGNIPEAHKWYRRATLEDPNCREAWYDLALAMQRTSMHLDAYYAAKKGLEITEMSGSYIHDPDAWNGTLEDLCSTSAWYIGLKDESIKYVMIAAARLPDNVRIQQNLAFITGAAVS